MLQQDQNVNPDMLLMYLEKDILPQFTKKLETASDPSRIFIEKVNLPETKLGWIACAVLLIDMENAINVLCGTGQRLTRASSVSEATTTRPIETRTRRAQSFNDFVQIKHERVTWGLCLERLWVIHRHKETKVRFYLIDRKSETKIGPQLYNQVKELQRYCATHRLSRFYFSTDNNWKPNFEAKQCDRCGKSFSWSFRRHHCRVCGNVFCSSCCSKMQVDLPIVHDSTIRVCSTCVEGSLTVTR